MSSRLLPVPGQLHRPDPDPGGMSNPLELLHQVAVFRGAHRPTNGEPFEFTDQSNHRRERVIGGLVEILGWILDGQCRSAVGPIQVLGVSLVGLLADVSSLGEVGSDCLLVEVGKI